MKTQWQKDRSNYWRLVRSPLYAWLWTLAAVAAVAGGLLICRAVGLTDMSTGVIFKYAVVFGLGHALGWYRGE